VVFKDVFGVAFDGNSRLFAPRFISPSNQASTSCMYLTLSPDEL
jgi:hypothetical protein